MAAVFSRLPMRVRCATQRDHVFHPEMNYSQTQLASLIGSPSGGWPTISRRARTSKKDKELVTHEISVSRNAFTIDFVSRIYLRYDRSQFSAGEKLPLARQAALPKLYAINDNR